MGLKCNLYNKHKKKIFVDKKQEPSNNYFYLIIRGLFIGNKVKIVFLVMKLGNFKDLSVFIDLGSQYNIRKISKKKNLDQKFIYFYFLQNNIKLLH